REENLSRLELLAFGGERLLDLYDHFGAAKNLVCFARDLGAGSLVVAVGKSGAEPGIGFDQNPMALGGQLACGRGNEAHAVFVVLHLLGNADEHLFLRKFVILLREGDRVGKIASMRSSKLRGHAVRFYPPYGSVPVTLPAVRAREFRCRI